MWLVMKVRAWASLEGYLNGSAIPISMAAPDSGSVGFVEVFEDKVDALAAANDNAALVLQVKEVPRG